MMILPLLPPGREVSILRLKEGLRTRLNNLSFVNGGAFGFASNQPPSTCEDDDDDDDDSGPREGAARRGRIHIGVVLTTLCVTS